MLASCIMVTRGRPAFALAALDDFMRQTYVSRELIVIDDIDDPSFPDGIQTADALGDLVLPAVRYYALPERLTIGFKRNLACALANGEVVLHWDDDDWHNPRRIEAQVGELLSLAPRVRMTGYHGMVFQEAHATEGRPYPRAWKYRGGSVIGASMCYYREFWLDYEFPDIQIGEDAYLISVAARAGALSFRDAYDAASADHLMVSRIHGHHTTSRDIVVDDDNWRECVFVKAAL